MTKETLLNPYRVLYFEDIVHITVAMPQNFAKNLENPLNWANLQNVSWPNCYINMETQPRTLDPPRSVFNTG